MKLPGLVGGALLILLSGCASTKQPPSGSTLPATPPTPPSSPTAPSAAPKTKAVAEIDALATGIDRDAKTNPKAARFFTGFLVSEGSSELQWAEFATKKQRENDTKGGYPDTWTTVERTKRGQIYVHSLRGMISSEGRYETASYYFRSDGTLAKLIFWKSDDMGGPGHKLTRYYNAKGKLLHSLTSSPKGEAVQLSPRVYKRVSELPVYRWLKKPRPKR